MQPNTGKLVIISGPSGVGKTSVVLDLLDTCKLALEKSVSATTRAPRSQEQDGDDYHFLTFDEFHRRRNAGEFLEAFEPYGNGTWYGTLRETVTAGLRTGKWVVLEIEVNGALEVMKQYPEAISIFVLPESEEVLERRLRNRGSETEEAVRRRLDRALYELSLAPRYRHQVINREGARDQTVKEICDILQHYGDK